MAAGTTGQVNPEASASWRALGTGVQVVVTDASQLTAARAMLEADLAAVDLACSRFRPGTRPGRQRSRRRWRRRRGHRCSRKARHTRY